MTHHTGTAHWRANTLEPTEMKLGCLDSSLSTPYVQKHASQFEMGFVCMRLLYVRKLRQEEGAMLRRLWVHFLTCCLLPEVVRYGKLLLDTDRSRSRLLSPSSSFSLPLSPNQGNGRQEGMEVTEPDGETSAGSSNRSSLDALEKSSYALIKTYAHFSSLSRAVVFKTDVRFTSSKTFSPPY